MVSLRSLIAGVAFIAAPAMAAMTALEIEDTFQLLAVRAHSLEEFAYKIDPANALLLPAGRGPIPVLLQGFADITNATWNADAELEGSSPLTNNDEADNCYYAFLGFVRRNQSLKNVLMGKASHLRGNPFVGQPMVDRLIKLKHAYEAIGTHSAALAGYRAGGWKSLSEDLSEDLKYLIEEWEKLILTNP
ncbi:hypothetical protein B0I37DRAFT_419555 [Chaetomium sp. MPI-CAGE-AT-0009]|nr:hypothetical protein B0I37DRAFT_419555 [Chaetomium sp. MPI-CAGE-AT-0009]